MTTPHDKDAALLPCPFCGGEPKSQVTLGVWCDNDACAIVGQVFSGGARHWNRRSALTASEAMPEDTRAKALNALLWFYRRAKPTHGRLPFAEEAIALLKSAPAQQDGWISEAPSPSDGKTGEVNANQA